MRQGKVSRNPATGRWGYVIDVNAPGQPRRQERVTTFRSQAEAQRALDQVRARLHAGHYYLEDVPTLAAYLDGWLERRAFEGLKPSTLAKYGSMLEAYVRSDSIGHKRLDRLKAEHFENLYQRLLTSGRKGRRSPATIRQLHVVLKKALGDAVARKLLWESPLAHVSIPEPVRTPEQRHWNREELSTFLAATSNDSLHALFWVAAHTGLRRGELVALRWNDIDLDAGSLFVRFALTMVPRPTATSDDWYVLTEPKSRKSRRTVSLDAGTVQVLLRHRHDQREWQAAVGVGYRDGGWVFANEHGDPYRPDSISQAFTRAVARVQRRYPLPDLHFHGLRHTHASVMFGAGISPKVVQERLGHSTVAFTLDTYVHTLPSQQRQAAEQFAASLSAVHLVSP